MTRHSRADVRIALYSRQWRSGTGRFAQELVGGLLDDGAEVIFISPAAEADCFETPRAGLARIRPPRERLIGGKAVRAVSSLLRVVGAQLGLLRARLSTRIFVISVPDPLILMLPTLAFLRLTGAMLIYVVHDPVPHAWSFPASFRQFENGLYAVTYRLASALVVLSESSRVALLGAYDLSGKPVAVIEHGVFVRGKPAPPPGDGTLLLFGSLRRNKGVREAIEGVIAAQAAGAVVHLVIAGAPHDEDPGYWAGCETLARANPQAIELHVGYIADADLDALIERCDAFLMPYQAFFSQSGVAMLAGSNARPVIATLAGGIGSLIAEGMPAVTIAEPVTGASIADAITAFAAVQTGEWQRRAAVYRQVMLDKRSWPAIGAQYLALARTFAG